MPLSYDLTPFQISRAEIVKFFRWYFGRNNDTKRTFEINWPLVIKFFEPDWDTPQFKLPGCKQPAPTISWKKGITKHNCKSAIFPSLQFLCQIVKKSFSSVLIPISIIVYCAHSRVTHYITLHSKLFFEGIIFFIIHNFLVILTKKSFQFWGRIRRSQ